MAFTLNEMESHRFLEEELPVCFIRICHYGFCVENDYDCFGEGEETMGPKS